MTCRTDRHFARFRESRGNGWHTDFGTKYSVLYPITAGDGNERGLAVASRVCDPGPKTK